MNNSAIKITEALAVCAEITGTEMTETAIRVMVADLIAYPLESVMMALQRCRRELTGRLTLAAILERINDGWPSADEAFNSTVEGWRNENLTIITTATAQLAANEAHALYTTGDKTGARMAFKASYERLVSAEKANSSMPHWIVSAGTDKNHLTSTIINAVKDGRLKQETALALLPSGEAREEVKTGTTLTAEQKLTGRKKLAPILALLTEKCALAEANHE